MAEGDIDDSDDEIILISASGIWTVPELDEHYRQLQEAIERFRRSGKPVRVLSDLTKAVQQSAEIEDRIQAGNDKTFRNGDRVAVLAGNVADKMLLRSVAGALFAIFTSRMAAEIWLMESQLPRPGDQQLPNLS